MKTLRVIYAGHAQAIKYFKKPKHLIKYLFKKKILTKHKPKDYCMIGMGERKFEYKKLNPHVTYSIIYVDKEMRKKIKRDEKKLIY